MKLCLKSSELLRPGTVLVLSVPTQNVDGCCLFMITCFARTGTLIQLLTALKHKGQCQSTVHLQ